MDKDITITPNVFYGNPGRNHSDDEDEDFEASDSEEYIPSDADSSDSDENILMEDVESENEDEEVLPSTSGSVSSNQWTPVTKTTLKEFIFEPTESELMQNINVNQMNPIDLFSLMVTDDVYQLIVTETNLNAKKYMENNTITRNSRAKDWKDTDVSEVKKFLGIVMYMGIVKYPSISLYWSKDNFYKNTFIPGIMSRNRFQLLLKFIHFANNSASESNRLGKISGLLEMLEQNFVRAKTPGEVLAVDESMIPWRGRLNFRQYNPGKAHKYGVKVYKLCDPSGYTYTSCIYAGKNYSYSHQRGKPTPSTSHSTQIVVDLAEKYLDKGRTIATDNFYTSVSLAKLLLSRKTHLIGTLRKNRGGNPKDVVVAKLRKHETIGRECASVIVSKWRDKRDVLMLSTKHGLEERSTGKRTRDGHDIKKPEVILDYNQAKQGIDVSDQMASYYTPLRKTIRWYHKIAFEFLLSTAVVNALVIYKKYKNIQIGPFRQAICESLCGVGVQEAQHVSITKHQLKEFETIDRTNRKTRKRCLTCYNELSKTEGRAVASKKAKKVSTYCSSCEGNPTFCMECFNKKH